METKKINVSFAITVDTDYDYLGKADDFELMTVVPNGTVSVAPSGAFSEIEMPTTGLQALVDADVQSGSMSIHVADGCSLVDGSVFSAAGTLYYVEDVVDNMITIRGKVIDAITAGTLLQESSASGIYQADVMMTELGDHLFVVRNPKAGMQNVPVTVRGVSEDIDDAHSKLDQLASSIAAVQRKTFV